MRSGERLGMIIVKPWVSLAPMRIDHRRESKGAQSGGFGNNSGES